MTGNRKLVYVYAIYVTTQINLIGIIIVNDYLHSDVSLNFFVYVHIQLLLVPQ